MSQQPRRLLERELEYFDQHQEPLNEQDSFPPPLEFVTMSHIEAFPVTELYGISPEAEKDEDEEMEDAEPRSLIVKLRIGRHGFERLRMREVHRRAMATQIVHQHNPPVVQAAPVQRDTMPMQITNAGSLANPLFVPAVPQSPVPNLLMATQRQNAASNARVPSPPSANRTISAPPTPASTTNISTVFNQNVLANRSNIPTHAHPITQNNTINHTHPTNPTTNTQSTTDRPIPTAIQDATNIILAVKQNDQQLPQKAILSTMEGFTSKGCLRAVNPLRDWYGDERLFDQRTWMWLAGEKS